ncbi:HD domain-containing phosphohydrolase [Maridesulfovibrio sp.]|uniref:HD domain-containing phosphohydrolase n=1 Tax=Maridesulfovibrio sp. TaxID=2795000 RepID=UPI002A189476|nr:HD domain-containing phosphohydrolase [Maridesulfovibrio sp.]
MTTISNIFRPKHSISIRFLAVGAVMTIGALIAGLAIGLDYYFNFDLAKTAAEKTFRSVSENISERVRSLDNQSANLIRILSQFSELEQYPPEKLDERFLSLITGCMKQTPVLSVYVGFKNGDFFEIVNLNSSINARLALNANPKDSWVVIRTETKDGKRVKHTVYMDENFIIRSQNKGQTDYTPYERPWFVDAVASRDTIRTKPYIFANLKTSGFTYAKSMDNGNRVVALNISLDGISNFLHHQHLPASAQVTLFDQQGNLIARTNKQIQPAFKPDSNIFLSLDERAFIAEHPVIHAAGSPILPFSLPVTTSEAGYSIDFLNLIAGKVNLHIEYDDKPFESHTDRETDLLHSQLKTHRTKELGIFTDAYTTLSDGIAVKRDTPLPTSLAALRGKRVAIDKNSLAAIYLKERYPDIRQINMSILDGTKAVALGQADAVIGKVEELRYLGNTNFIGFIRLGIQLPTPKQGMHFVVRPDIPQLATILNKAIAAVTPDEKRWLNTKWFGNQAVDANLVRGRKALRILELAADETKHGKLQFLDINEKQYLGYLARIDSDYGGHVFLGMLLPLDVALQPYLEKIQVSIFITFSVLLLLSPLAWFGSTFLTLPIRALSRESEKVTQRRFDEVCGINSNITEIQALSTSMTSMASSIRAHEKSRQELLDSFIRLIASAIDFKSPYTGGHCARVPKLSIMLAQAASACDEGEMADFSLDSEEQWREFKVAAWLHDCGKITTPEYIVDKATKLETIYNRIHEIRTRFEVLLRDAEIEYLQAVLNGGEEKELAPVLHRKKEEIREDFAFIASCNIGGEAMGQSEIDRIKSIGKKTWIRQLDDRLGLSPQELKRYPEQPRPLPCVEKLLADKPEQILDTRSAIPPRTESDSALKKPVFIYNHGELYNLSITRGTLTPEERDKINEHILITIRMLETLPLPPNMAKIPEYAGAHHETLNGTGYPRGLKGKDISIPSRIIAIADIFEALTASDRPYKKNKTLSEAINIMAGMVKAQRLDPELFRLFLESGIYLKYARRYLAKDQLDKIDISAILSNIDSLH